MIKVLAKITLKPGSWDSLTHLFHELIDKTRKEKGCLEYNLFIDLTDENVCCMVESWESEEALEAHVNTEHFMRILPQIGESSAAPPDIAKMREFKTPRAADKITVK
jgi:quinol monooxygenase YgiN